VSTYKIVGPLPVAGKQPGEDVTTDDLEGCDVVHLVEAGHIAPTGKSTNKAAQATSPKE
jgi:hypothetical protein